MSDTDKPELPPEAEGPPAANRGRVPSLDAQQRYGGGKRRGETDAEIERELQEAMGGLSAEELFADPNPRGHKPPAAEAGPPGRKKGKVHSVRGKDVFVEVPGGRS